MKNNNYKTAINKSNYLDVVLLCKLLNKESWAGVLNETDVNKCAEISHYQLNNYINKSMITKTNIN